MNWSAIAAGVSILGLIATVVAAAYNSGKITQEIRENRLITSDHSVTLREHSTKLEDHGIRIGRLQEWKDGFRTGASLSGNKETQ